MYIIHIVLQSITGLRGHMLYMQVGPAIAGDRQGTLELRQHWNGGGFRGEIRFLFILLQPGPVLHLLFMYFTSAFHSFPYSVLYCWCI